MVADPADRVLLPMVALPLLASSTRTGWPSVEVPPATPTMKFTVCRGSDGFGPPLLSVVVVLLWTNCRAMLDWLGPLKESPLYWAKMLCEPADKLPTEMVAAPALRTALPTVALPLL